jgi:hypothetical protein
MSVEERPVNALPFLEFPFQWWERPSRKTIKEEMIGLLKDKTC